MTTGTVTTNKITIELPKLSDAGSPELMARLEEIRLEMPEMTVEEIYARIITNRMMDRIAKLVS